MTESQDVFNVFISWSGTLSKRIAYIVQDWIATTVQLAIPFVSDKDIDAGDRGLVEIEENLNKIRVGIICLTAENQNSPWLNFEAGALSKKLGEKSWVAPLLFDIGTAQVRYPMAQFQLNDFSEEGVASVARTVNKAMEKPVNAEKLSSALRLTWPDLASKIEAIRSEGSQQVLVEEPTRSTDEMFEEIIVAVRDQSLLLEELKKNSSKITIADQQLELTKEALSKLTEYNNRSRRLTAKEVADMEESLDKHDWRLINTAPFLRWYLEHYFNVFQHKAPAKEIDYSDVPF